MRNAKSLENSAASYAAQKSTDPARRRFLFTLGVSGAGAAAAASGALQAAPPPESAPAGDDGAYRESEHVRDYYRTTRI
ncbi:MAG TPA: formate dehydrogenase [Casimicrobiaceae bacterium]|nr:formate dehydrogenase [Casimicrobiaceae bacterium]